jgi:hypothetical protein
MFTLIKREILDHIAYFIGAAIFSALFIIFLFSIISRHDSVRGRSRDYSDPEISLGVGVPVIAVVVIGICGLGVSQMYLDKNRRISAFLSTLAVSRDRILLSRIITGILVILTLLLPVAVAAVVLLRLYTPDILNFSGMVFEIFLASFLTAFSCYCIGLQTGWTAGKVAPTLGGLLLTFIFLPLILIKGFDLQAVTILLLFIIASLIRIRHTFMTTSL